MMDQEKYLAAKMNNARSVERRAGGHMPDQRQALALESIAIALMNIQILMEMKEFGAPVTPPWSNAILGSQETTPEEN